MTMVSSMRRPAMDSGTARLFGQERRDHVVQETPAKLRRADPAVGRFEPAAFLRARERRRDRIGTEAAARDEIGEGEAVVQAQRVEHEFERYLIANDRLVAADAARRAGVFQKAARRADFPAAPQRT